MSTPMWDGDDHGWREVEVDITRRVCPYGRNPAVGCGIGFWVDADGQWVEDCTMAGIGSECVWRHPERVLPDLLKGPPEIANPWAVPPTEPTP